MCPDLYGFPDLWERGADAYRDLVPAEIDGGESVVTVVLDCCDDTGKASCRNELPVVGTYADGGRSAQGSRGHREGASFEDDFAA